MTSRGHFAAYRGGIVAIAALTAFSLTACSGGDNNDSSSASSGTQTTKGSSGKSASGSSSASSSSGPVGQPTPVKGKKGSVTIAASGDIMGNPVMVEVGKTGDGYSYTKFIDPIKPFLSKSDVKICQMEAPLSPTNSQLSTDNGFPSFNVPHQWATAVKQVGFDGCSTANNHTYDRSLQGLRDTRKVMADNNLKASGPGADAKTPGDPVFYEAKGFKIAQLSYSYTLDNRFGDETGAPKTAPWTKSNLYAARTPEGIKQDAAAARAKGADIVVVSMHWGIEYSPVSAEQKQYANDLLKSGQVDWIVGNHPHIVQACQKINGRYVNYALGNTMGSQVPSYWIANKGAHVDDGALAAVTFTRDDDGKITEKMTVAPTNQKYSDHIVRLATPSSNADAYNRVMTTMNSMGCGAEGAK